jgi:predicted ATPase
VLEAYNSSNSSGSWLDKHEVDYSEFLFNLGIGLDALMRSRSNDRVWVDNSPENLLIADDLLLMFPDALIINVVRDPREVCASMLLSGFNREPWSTDLDEAISTWKHYASIGTDLKSRHPDGIAEVMHRDMVHQPDELATALAALLKIPSGDSIANFLQEKRINSSYDARSRLADASGAAVSASRERRRQFLDENSDYILTRCEPYAELFGFHRDLKVEA